ncbi:hypothetical protein [Muricoccus radiodurans]|uniref:hypothetical protein n=1 Tax=Muricoccus radiodurans TaxID=2231721 RepID=UPI003CFA0BEB
MDSNSRFERHLDQLGRSPHLQAVRDALIEVADTAYGCKLWFESNRMQASAADVVAMTRLVLTQKARAGGERVGDASPEPVDESF